jgi:prephenate dehydrogenase
MDQGGQLPEGLGRVALLGTGLIGGSFAAALKRHGLASRIIGFSAGDDAHTALQMGLLDDVARSPRAAVAGCDTVVLAAPVSVNIDLLADIGGALPPGTLVMDVSSVKLGVVQAARRHLGDALSGFVPCHPIAGSERSGPGAADAELFAARTVILSPLESSEPSKVARLERTWERLGAVVLRMSPQEHDRVYALVSHWPHALGFALAAAIDDNGIDDRLVGQGLLDLTRTAASSPDLWADILLQNARPALEAADLVAAELAAIRGAVERRDRAALAALFSRAAAWRNRVG